MTAFSVIIPLFNKEATIDDCLQSLLDSTFKDFEVIIVDDGSTDSSAQHVQSFITASADARFTLISQENAGPAAAVNTGIKQACGTYITRVDADDRVLSHGFERLMAPTLKDHPVCVRGKLQRFNNTYKAPKGSTRGQIEHLPEDDSSSHKNLPPLLAGGQLYTQLFRNITLDYMSLSGALYPLALIQQHQITLEPTLRHAEDLLFNAHVYALNTPWIIVEEPVYAYRQSAESLSHRPQNRTDLLDACFILARQLKHLEDAPDTARVAKGAHDDALHYLGVFLSLGILQLEEGATAEEFESDIKALLEQDEYKKLREELYESEQQTSLLHVLITHAEDGTYEQLRLTARIVNRVRALRRRLKLL